VSLTKNTLHSVDLKLCTNPCELYLIEKPEICCLNDLHKMFCFDQNNTLQLSIRKALFFKVHLKVCVKHPNLRSCYCYCWSLKTFFCSKWIVYFNLVFLNINSTFFKLFFYIKKICWKASKQKARSNDNYSTLLPFHSTVFVLDFWHSFKFITFL